jgi:phosphoenolpyruvate---glycerone phosphotransferase subunit DhaK
MREVEMSKVKKLINNVSDLVPETLEGLVLASHGRLKMVPGTNALIRSDLEDDKVALLIGGGSGHEPMYTAYVGKGWADVSVAGHIFAAPAPDLVFEAAKAAHRGRGVLFVYGNYAGDNMNFDIAAEMLTDVGIEVRTVRVCDDVAVKDPAERRGIAGAFYMVKVAGAACTWVKNLDEAERLVRKAQANIRSIGVAVKAGSLPETGELTFELGDDEIEIGMGAHGEPGVERRKLMPADELADEMTRLVLEDLPFKRGDRLAMLLNNLGSTTMMELMIINRRVRARLAESGIEVARTDAGPLLTCQEMAGMSLTLMKVDEELERALSEPAWSLGYRQT